MWKNSLKTVECDNNKILYETLLDFLQRNGTYFLNKLRVCVCVCVCVCVPDSLTFVECKFGHYLHIMSRLIRKRNSYYYP